MDGLFTIPYEPISGDLDINKVYFFDNLLSIEGGGQLPQIFNYRFWAWQAIPFLNELSKNGFRITDQTEADQPVAGSEDASGGQDNTAGTGKEE